MRSMLISARRVAAVTALMLAACLIAGAQQGNAGKTAGQVYKNVQILKDIPSGQFIPTMRFVAAALGVECEYCHMGNRSVETPNKQTARKMMTMMLALNKENFEGRLEVTCYTCHKGTHDPVSAPTPTGQYSAEGPTFYRPIAPPVGATDEPMSEAYQEEAKKEQAAKAALPKPEQILASYVTALGGEQALRKVTSRVVTSSTELSPNVRGAGPTIFVQETQYFKAPNLYAATFQGFSGAPPAKGFDGKDAWTQNANGAVNQASGTDLERATRAADLYESINLAHEYTRLNLRGVEKRSRPRRVPGGGRSGGQQPGAAVFRYADRPAAAEGHVRHDSAGPLHVPDRLRRLPGCGRRESSVPQSAPPVSARRTRW